MSESLAEFYPEGRFLYYEGDDPAGFAQQLLDTVGLDPRLDRRWGTGCEPDGFGGEIVDPFGRLYGFHCPPKHLDDLMSETGLFRYPLGS